MLDAEAREPVARDVLRAGVFRLGEDDVVAALELREQRAGDGAHARGVGHGTLAVLEGGQLLLEIVLRGVRDAAVGEALGVVIAGLHRIVGGVEIERRGLVDRRDQRAVGVARLTCVHLQRVKVQAVRLQVGMSQLQLAHNNTSIKNMPGYGFSCIPA